MGSTDRQDDARRHYEQGLLLEGQDRFPEAVTEYRAALRLDPDYAKAHNNLGGALQMVGAGEEALACFEKARQLDPALWQPYYNIGNFHKLAGKLDAAVRPYQDSTRRRRKVDGPADPDPVFSRTSRSKLQHDIEQLEYLMGKGVISPGYRSAVTALESCLRELEAEFKRSHMVDIPPSLLARVAPVYNRLVNYYDAPDLAGPAVNPALDRSRLEADYAGSGPGIVWVDDLLTPAALRELRRFCLESTVWFDCSYPDGYLGAYIEEGFICPLLAQIARELPRALPGIFRSEPLTHLWAYKYDSTLSGIGVHGDFAAVNVNFWITPEEANLDPAHGGLVVWDKEAPADWDFETYNKNVPRIEQFLRETAAKPVTVPYRQNRAVIFNSDLFHRTDRLRFKPGYENRRINVTMLYGNRGG